MGVKTDERKDGKTQILKVNQHYCRDQKYLQCHTVNHGPLEENRDNNN